MKIFEVVMKIVWGIIAAVINVFIFLANLIIGFINLFRRKDKKIAKIEYVPMKMEEGMGEEPGGTPPPDDTDDGGEPSPPDDTDDPSGNVPQPPTGTTTPTGSADESVSKGGGGGGGGGDTYLLNIYIVPEIAEFWDELGFADELASKLAIEMKSRRGVYLT